MKRWKPIIATVCIACLVFAMTTTPALAADPADVEAAIEAGLEYLASQQNANGSFGSSYQQAATALVLIKLQDRAKETLYDPFDPGYQYSTQVVAGWDYLFSFMQSMQIWPQDHTAGASNSVDDPDSNGNGLGIYWSGDYDFYETYTSGLVLTALASSGDPDRAAPPGGTYGSVAQDVCDYLAFGQVDMGPAEGGWWYQDVDNADGGADNSNSGYAVLGLAAGESFGCIVPAWLKTELNAWIGAIQDPVDGDADDGGSYYDPTWLPDTRWCNELKTGNLIFQMTFVGDETSTPRFQDAMDYIESHWQDPNTDPGWGYNVDPANYQAMFCLTKGLEYSGVDSIDLGGEHDWYAEFSDVLVAQQNADGSWDDPYFTFNPVFGTCWALLTLEGIRAVKTDDPVTVESDCFTEQEVEIPIEMAFTVGHKLKVSVDDVSILLGEKLLPGDEGEGDFMFTVWSNDDVECRLASSNFTGDDLGVNDEDADTLTYPDGVTASDWDATPKCDDDELAPHTILGSHLAIALNGFPYAQGSWHILSNGPTGDDGVDCSVGLMLPITYADHAGTYTGTLILDVRQF